MADHFRQTDDREFRRIDDGLHSQRLKTRSGTSVKLGRGVVTL
jgi:hypothetical protein